MARWAFLAAAAAAAALTPAVAQTARVALDSWAFAARNGSLRVANASVPGTAHTHLHAAGVLDDPYWRYNELAYRWVAQETWVYETRVALDAVPADTRASLVFECLDGPAEVLVNGHSVAHTANSFQRFALDVTDALTPAGTENEIAVVFSPATQYARDAAARYPYFVPETVNYNVWAEPSRRSFVRKAGSDFGWDWGPAFATTGMAGRAYLELAAPAPTLEDIDVDVQFGASDSTAATVTVRVFVARPSVALDSVSFSVFLNGEQQVSLTRSIGTDWTSEKPVQVSFVVNNPTLWWPNGYGEPFLYDLRVNAQHATGAASISHRLGFRRVELVEDDTAAGGTTGKTFYFKVNDVPVFAKGANWIPSDSFPTRVNQTMMTHLLSSAQAAHMNMIRVWGGGRYESDFFYSECDRLGLLVWQELMFACGMYPRDAAFLENVEAEVKFQLTRLRKYASIAIWGGNNENENMMEQFVNATFFPPGESFNRDIAVADFSKLFVDVIYPLVKSLDPARPFVDTSPSNGVFSHEPYVKRWGSSNGVAYGDVHFYNYDGDCQDFQMYPRARFISEFGFQSAPSGAAMRRISSPSDWTSFQSFWELLKFRERHENGTGQMLTQMERRFHVPFPFRDEKWLSQPFGATDEDKFGFDIAERIDSYLYLTQIQQALCYQTAIRTWRRGKHHDLGMTMGILYWQLNDIWEGTSWSSMEFSGRWKSLHHVVRREFAPFILSIYEQTDDGTLGIFGVSDINADVNVVIDYELRRTATGALIKTVWREAVALSPLESKPIRQLSIRALLDEKETGCSRQSCFLYVHCSIDNARACEDTYHFFAPYKHLQLGSGSINALITPASSGDTNSFEVKIESSAFVALFVELDVPGWRGIWSTNTFLMLANQTKTLVFTSTDGEVVSEEAATELTAALQIRWLQRIYDNPPVEIEVE